MAAEARVHWEHEAGGLKEEEAASPQEVGAGSTGRWQRVP